MRIGDLIEDFLQNHKIKKQGGEKTSQLLRDLTEFRYHVKVGLYSYGSCFDKSFNTGGKVVVGQYTSFGPNIRYYGANHPLNCVSMSPYFYQQKWADTVGGRVRDVERHVLSIGNDCWLGSGVIITCGCHSIGNGAVIGAGSVVTKNVAPYTIVAGNPAKEIRKRFSNEEIRKLELSKWYDLSPDILLKHYDLYDSPMLFGDAIIKYREEQNE